MVDRPRYRTVASDSERWEGFRFREGDVVISTPPKCGTTWTQMLCALLILGTDEFDRPLTTLSPWFDAVLGDRSGVVAELDAQGHRRFVKSHTPLDGIPFDPRVTYITVGRDPRDVALSLDNHIANMRPEVVADAMARAGTGAAADEVNLPPSPGPADDPRDRFWAWATAEPAFGPAMFPGNLAAVLHHLGTFWDRRHEPGVVLLHYDELGADLTGQVKQLAEVLGIDLDDDRAAWVAEAAGFDRMRSRADELAPEVSIDLWKDNSRFFHKGASGQWRDLLDDDDLRRYRARVAELAPPDLATWAHTDWP